MSAKLAKKKLRLEASGRSVQRFLDLGWVKIKTRFCQVIRHKNRIHRIIYFYFGEHTFEQFNYSIIFR
jgi:hypothetical protein